MQQPLHFIDLFDLKTNFLTMNPHNYVEDFHYAEIFVEFSNPLLIVPARIYSKASSPSGHQSLIESWELFRHLFQLYAPLRE